MFLEIGHKEPLNELGYWGEESDGPVTLGLVGRLARFEDGDYAAHFPQHHSTGILIALTERFMTAVR